MVDHHSLALLHGHVLYCHPIAPSPRLCNAKLCNYTCLRGQACAALPEMFFFSHPPLFQTTQSHAHWFAWLFSVVLLRMGPGFPWLCKSC